MLAPILLIGVVFSAEGQDASLRFELPTLPGLQRHVDLLDQPGYVAIALENNGLSPSVSSKLKVSDHGRSAEIRNAAIRFAGKEGTTYNYEASVQLGLGDAKLSMPVKVDVSGIGSGKVVVTLTPPLATFIPREVTDRLRIKLQLIANVNAQQRVLDYFDALSKQSPTKQAVVEAILLEGYNKGGGLFRPGGRDVGDAVPLSEQWLLLLTLGIWLIVVPGYLLYARVRRSRQSRA